jgi:putative membrane protein
MPLRDLLSEEGRRLAAAAVRAAEAETSAELVLAVRPASARYREADYLFGFLWAVGTLLALLYLPQPFALGWFAVDIVAAFLAGTLVGSLFPSLRRWLVSRKAAEDAVARAAKAAFVDLDVSRTRDRTGVLVYVSAYERLVEVVADVGVVDAAKDRPWHDAVQDLRGALRPTIDRERLLAALQRLGAALAPSLPRAEDDVNELPDGLDAAEESWP